MTNKTTDLKSKADMINALTYTMKVNKEILGEYKLLRNKALSKLEALIDSIDVENK